METTRTFRSMLALAALVFCVQTAVADDAKTAKYEWIDTPGKSLELKVDGKPVVRYMYEALDESSPERRAETYKPYLHVFSPDGKKILTKGPGGLYPHHRGIYFGFNKITYGDGQKCDTWHCTGKAYQSHEEFVDKSVGKDGARLEVKIDWHGKKGEVFATENRVMEIASTDEGTTVDFATTLRPVGDDPIHLDGDPQHAGVQFRASQDVAEKTKGSTYYVRTDGKGKKGETRNWDHKRPKAKSNPQSTNLPWNTLCFVLDGKRYSVQYIDHPKNPKPSRYSERDYGRFGSYFVTDVTKDEPLHVDYRFLIRQGEMTVDQCEANAKAYTD